jgi:hypothetical protein
MDLVKKMSTIEGRSIRNVVGAVLIEAGYLIHNRWGYLLILIGLIPLLAASFNVCLITYFTKKK